MSYLTVFVTAAIQTGQYCFPGVSCSSHATLLLGEGKKPHCDI